MDLRLGVHKRSNVHQLCPQLKQCESQHVMWPLHTIRHEHKRCALDAHFDTASKIKTLAVCFNRSKHKAVVRNTGNAKV